MIHRYLIVLVALGGCNHRSGTMTWRDPTLSLAQRTVAFDRALESVSGMTAEEIGERFPVETSSRISGPGQVEVRSLHMTAPDGTDRWVTIVNGVAE